MRVRLSIMLFLVAAATITAVSSSSDAPRDPPVRNLVVNGDSAMPSDYQYFVRSSHDSILQTPDLLCGASLIHSDMIMSAAHCRGAFNYGALLYNPLTGAFDWYATVDKQIAHPDYYSNLQVINNDILVLRLSEPITGVAPVKLNQDPYFPVPGVDIAQAAGFGLTSYNGSVSRNLQVGNFSPISNEQCLQRGDFVNVVISDDILCVDPQTDDSVCAGDSGGPLTVPLTVSLVEVAQQQTTEGGSTNSNGDGRVDSGATAVQVGIVSFGTNCQADSVPDGMTRVSYFYDWIMEQICRYSRMPPIDCPSDLIGDLQDTIVYQDAVTIRLDFQHDFSAEETTFAVRNVLSDTIEFDGPEYVPKRGERVASNFLLLPGDYFFEVYDSYGNGLQNPEYVRDTYPTGNWTLSALYGNGEQMVLATGGDNFESLQTTQFTVPELPPILEASTTDQPTASPTASFPTDTPYDGTTISPSSGACLECTGSSVLLDSNASNETSISGATPPSAWSLSFLLLSVLTVSGAVVTIL